MSSPEAVAAQVRCAEGAQASFIHGRLSGNYSLPLPLTVFNPLPASINTSIVDEEKQTYYWYVPLLDLETYDFLG